MEFIPRARFPQELAQKVLDVQAQKPNLAAEAIEAAGLVGAKYIDTKTAQKREIIRKAEEAKLLSEQRIVDVKKQHNQQIADLAEKGYLEFDPEKLKQMKPGDSMADAILRWIPTEERRASASGAGTKYNLPADETLMKAAETIVDAYNKSTGKDYEAFKFDRSKPPTIHSAQTKIDSIKAALMAEGKSLEAVLAQVPSKEIREKVLERGRGTKDIIAAPTVKEKVAPEIVELIKKAKVIKSSTGTVLTDFVKSSMPAKERQVKDVIMKMLAVDDVTATEIYNQIRK